MKRYSDLKTYLQSLYGCRVHKIAVDAGLTCPNRDGTVSTGGCIYCNSRGSGSGAYNAGMSVTEQIRQGKKAIIKRFKAKKFIVYFQSFSNTYAPVARLKELYDEALAVEDVVGLSIGTRPDCVDEPILDLLQGYARNHLVWVEYGLQSGNDQTLAFINRGHDVRCFQNAVKLTANRGIKICAHVILGLPHETRRDMLHTAQILADLGVDGVKLHLLYVARGTRLHRLYEDGKFRCLGQEEYVELTCDFLERLPSSMVIQRLTGDPHPQELVAPRWSLKQKKNETLALINAALERRDTWQGKLVDN